MSEEQDIIEIVESPINLPYSFTAGTATTKFLKSIKEGKLVGQKSSVTGKVTFPPRGADPETGTPTTEEVELPDVATVISFTIVHIPIPNNPIQPPFIVANMVLDDSDQTFIHLVSGVPNEDVHIGMKVKAVWKDSSEWDYSFENVKYFEPTGEPSVDIKELKMQRYKALGIEENDNA